MRKSLFRSIFLILALLGSGNALAKKKSNAAPVPTGHPKQTIMVGSFDNAEIVGGTTTAIGLGAMLTEALVKDGNFVVIERGGPADGKTLNAQVIILGTVIKFTPNAGGGALNIGNTGGGFLGMLGSSAGAKTAVAKVEVNLRLIDSTTSQVLYSGSASGSASTKDVGVNIYTAAGMQIGQSAFFTTPLGKASQQAIGDAVKKIHESMAKVPWSAYVIDTDGANAYINAGADGNIREGMTFHAYRNGKQLVDPQTHVVLDTITDDIGTCTVQSVRSKISICSTTGSYTLIAGDILKLQ
jgi:curli biogenesis system outer membrane secretion channel CsgG